MPKLGALGKLGFILRRLWYRKVYLKSKHWKNFKKRVQDFYGHQCQVKYCKEKNIPLDVHHKTYVRLGKEKMSDVVLICRSHHQRLENGGTFILKNGKTLWK